MGRTILILVVLLSTIYGGIIISVQKEMYKLPDVMKDNFIHKEIENVSDYALRAAVRLGTESPEFRMDPADSVKTLYFDGGTDPNHFPVYRQYPFGPGGIYYNIKEITYTRTKQGGPDLYQAKVTIERQQQTDYDSLYTYVAQIGYEYFDPEIDGPLVLYGDYGAQFHIPEIVEDTSLQDPPTEGYLFGIGTEHAAIVKLASQGVWGTGSGHKCFEFGHNSSQLNGENHKGAGIQVPNPINVTDYETVLNRLKQYDEFTVSCYAKIRRLNNTSINEGFGSNGTGGNIVNNRGNCGTLMWYASNPYSARFFEPGYARPSIGLWYDSYRLANPNKDTVTMHYGITIDDGTEHGTYYEIIKTGVPTYSHPQQGDWRMFTLTFYHGTLTAYYDMDVVGSLTGLGGSSIIPNDYGFTIGVRDIRADASRAADSIYVHGRVAGVDEFKATGTNYMFYNGYIDYYSYWDVALTPDQIEDWYNQTIGKTAKHYIKD